jgi:hypothetical protein
VNKKYGHLMNFSKMNGYSFIFAQDSTISGIVYMIYFIQMWRRNKAKCSFVKIDDSGGMSDGSKGKSFTREP